MIITSSDISKKQRALELLLQNFNHTEKMINSNFNGEVEVMCFIPEGLVSVAIGHKGRLIHHIED
jgi:putative heme iron utilization protein